MGTDTVKLNIKQIKTKTKYLLVEKAETSKKPQVWGSILALTNYAPAASWVQTMLPPSVMPFLFLHCTVLDKCKVKQKRSVL